MRGKLKITFVSVGPVKKACFKDVAEDYLKRIKRYVPVETVEVKDEKASIKTPREDILRKEGERILKKLRPGDFNVVLTEGGRMLTSRGLAELIGGLASAGKKGLTFVVGGPFGLHGSVYEASDMEMSLSPMTLPHDMARVVLAEQVDRAFTILKGEPYSH